MIAVLAVSATTVIGVASAAGCSDKATKLGGNQTYGKTGSTITTAAGEVNNISSGKVYYVAPDGSSSNEGTKDSPMEIMSLLNSTSILKPGDTVMVEPGVYELAKVNHEDKITMLVSGEYNKYITIKNADPTKQCVLDFSNQTFLSTNRGVAIYGSYIYWYGIDICGAGDNGLYIGGNYNTVEYCEFYNCRDTGLQLGRSYGEYAAIDQWPSYNLVKNCTSHNNYDNDTYGENADGFAAKLTVGYGNVFDGCIAYRNSDDGWDLYAKTDSGNIGAVIMYNCVAFENGFLEYTQIENNKRFPTWNGNASEADTTGGITEENKYGNNSYLTRDGDGNGFKLGGSVMEGDVVMYNCLSFNNRMHGVTDNSNPGIISIKNVTSYNNSAWVDDNPASDYFGYILDVVNPDTHANIDLSRQIYSYNNINHVLSLSDSLAKSLSNDAYRASVVDSILLNKRIEGSLDADTKNDDGATGDTIAQPATSDVFAVLPYTKTVPETEGADPVYTFNIHGLKDLYADGTQTTLNPNRVHVKYRNAADGSINMGDILRVKDYTNLFGDDNKIGSVLNLTSYGAYTHYFAEDFPDGNAGSENAAAAARIKEALTLNCDPDAVYQDFDIPTKMSTYSYLSSNKETCKITWQSGNENVLKINEAKLEISTSKSEYIMAEVYRPADKDVKVTLTATITVGNATETKTFELTIKAGTPKVGTIYVKAADGTEVKDGGVLIVDHYMIYREPEVLVENGIDYHGKLLSKDVYDVKTTYMFTDDKTVNSVPVAGFTPSNAGVYVVTNTVSLKSDPTQSRTMSYTVYVASPYAVVDFMGGASVVVNRNGYIISGEMSNATGALYAVSSPTELNITEENKTDLLTASGVEHYEFRGDMVSNQFKNTNSGNYYIYYAVTNLNGEIQSPLYTKQISVVEITNEDDFKTVVGGKALGEEEPACTIYSLAKDLDFNGKEWTVSDTAFRGLLNGNGHTVKNLTVANGVGVFYKVDGGTVQNIKFENVNINNSKPKTALVSECTGGYFYNIQIKGINVVTSDQRAGGLIGHINVGTPVSIEQVSIDNSDAAYADYKIKASQRVGGLVGFSQASSSHSSGSINVSISDCLVNATITGDYELGGIYGNYDCGNNKNCTYNLEINHCVFNGKVISTGSKSYAGGILGYQKGAYAVMTIQNCISVGEQYFAGDLVDVALKNCSGIVGSSTTLLEGLRANVRNCYARMEEYNSNFEVYAWDRYGIVWAANYKEVGLDETKWTFIKNPDDEREVMAPYVTLNYLD